MKKKEPIVCDCKHKFDICYCDNTCKKNPNEE